MGSRLGYHIMLHQARTGITPSQYCIDEMKQTLKSFNEVQNRIGLEKHSSKLPREIYLLACDQALATSFAKERFFGIESAEQLYSMFKANIEVNAKNLSRFLEVEKGSSQPQVALSYEKSTEKGISLEL